MPVRRGIILVHSITDPGHPWEKMRGTAAGACDRTCIKCTVSPSISGDDESASTRTTIHTEENVGDARPVVNWAKALRRACCWVQLYVCRQ